ncbi:TIGR00730 family Rossman fold protein [Nevskia soli]|uniref:LOG family protein n=1 Tax=Nevskia soli TaxID=418856 RepID=UPI00068FB4DB|nr:TIGR00730 family Rossman fold protein [Nevskia soli]
MRSVAVYCGSSPGFNPVFRAAAEALGRTLAQSACTLVYGGSHAGLMGAVADAALAAGGKVIGVIPDALVSREVAHRGLSELQVVGSMHERKARMAELSEAFVALPGGIGTLDEIVEMFTWTQLGIHRKPCAFLNIGGYYDSLLAFLRTMVAQGFLRQAQVDQLVVAERIEDLLPHLAAAQPHPAGRLADIDRELAQTRP